MTQHLRRQASRGALVAVRPQFETYQMALLLLAMIALTLLSPAIRPVQADEVQSQVRLWNVNLLTLETRLSPPEEGTPLQPISIVGARNGHFSGKIMIESKPALTGLKATAGSLTGPSGAGIPAGAVQVRYGVQWDAMAGHFRPAGNDVLLDTPPAEVGQASIWVTVNIPADARPGEYTGSLTVEPQPGVPPISVPLHLKVVDWKIPDNQDWRVWIELVQSIDTTAIEYQVPLWSEDHWKHMARSFEHIGAIGSRVVSLPIICHTNYGNAESLIRWIPQEDGSWQHDFSRFERYLDTAIKHMGKPKIVVINAWDVYLNPPAGDIQPIESMPEEHRTHNYHLAVKRMADARRALRGKGPAVTVTTDAAKGETDTLYMPPLEDEQSEELWKPVWQGMRERLQQRGLLDVTMIGMLTDTWPTKEQAEFLHKVSGGMKWISNSHWSAVKRRGGKIFGIAEVGYETNVWDIVYTVNPAIERTHGWRRPELVGSHYRLASISRMLPSTFRTLMEANITGNQHGVGRVGADYWWAVRDGRGSRSGTVTSRFLQSQWRNLDIMTFLLAPGADGTVATARYEYLREGAQDSEARIFIEQALLDESSRAALGDDLATRAQNLLDQRQRAIWQARGVDDEEYAKHGSNSKVKTNEPAGHAWYVDSNWQAQTEKLFMMAAEVAAKL